MPTTVTTPGPVGLPNELLFEILTLLRSTRQNPLDILLVSSNFYHLYSQLLYNHLCFTKITQITRFLQTFVNRTHTTGAVSTTTTQIPQPIRNVTIDVFNDLELGLYIYLRDLFTLCANSDVAPEAEVDECGRIILETLKFRFHTHAMDKSLHVIYEALSCVNPRSFTWIGPDPPHHFSAAIVPAALSHLFRALTTQTNLTHLTLSHVKFPDNGEILSLPHFPSLKSLNLSQVIFLQPDIVARFIMSADTNLERIQLIDAYQQSIWGPRLRRSHIEVAASARGRVVEECVNGMGEDYTIGHIGPNSNHQEILSKIRLIVVCQGKFERIIGGDRVLRDSILV